CAPGAMILSYYCRPQPRRKPTAGSSSSGGLLMSVWKTLGQMIRGHTAHHRGPRRQPRRLALEVLEDRLCPSGGSLLVDSFDNNPVLRYSEASGAFVDTFVPKESG